MISQTKLGMTPEMEALMELLPDTFLAKEIPLRTFDVTVYLADGEILEQYKGISAQAAGIIRNTNRRLGYRVNQIEISNLSGVVEQHDFIPPETHISQVMDKPISFIPKYNSHTAKANAQYRDKFFKSANADLKRHSDTNNNHSLVYDKFSGKLVFSGNVDDAIQFIQNKMNSGEWNDTSWVLYLPTKLYNKVIG